MFNISEGKFIWEHSVDHLINQQFSRSLRQQPQYSKLSNGLSASPAANNVLPKAQQQMMPNTLTG